MMAIHVQITCLCLLFISVRYAATQVTPAENGETCPCEYIEQPPNELQCNPYQLAELRLECTILIPSSQLSKGIVWFRSHLQTPSDAPEAVSDTGLDRWFVDRLGNEQPNIQILQQNLPSSDGRNMWIRSQLRISNLNDSYIGDYVCRAVVDGSEWLIPSDSVYLQQSSSYTHFGPCSSQFAQSKQERKCAGWDVRNSMSPTTHTITSQRTPSTSTDQNAPTDSTAPPVDTHSKPPSTETKVTTTKFVDSSTTSIPDQSSGTSNISGSGGDVLIIDDKGDDDETDSNRSLLIELYVSISILVLFGVIIFVLVPVMLYLCFRRKTKVRNCRQTHDLARIQPANIERRSATMPVASDYLIPQPFLGLTQDQLEQQTQRLNRSRSLQHHSYETTLGFSHEYEDVIDFVDSGGEKSDTRVNITQPEMKRNAAYRAYSTSEDERGMTRIQLLEGASCHDIIIPNPLNCINTQSRPARERMSDDSDDQDSLVNTTIRHSYEQV